MIDVLWLEDQANTLRDFFELAQREGVNLITKETALEAEQYIRLHPEHIDAAILDARGFEISTSEQKGTRGMHIVKDLLKEHSIPYSIFSGEASLMTNEEFVNTLPKEVRIFEKGKDESNVLDHTKKIVANFPNVKTKKEYRLAFSVFSRDEVYDLFDDDEILGSQLNLIKLIQNREDVDVVGKMIRCLYEDFLFPIFDNYGICDNDDDFNEKARSCNRGNYIGRSYIGDMIRMVGLYSQAINHGTRVEIRTYLNSSGNKYYLSCLVEGMLAIMSWLPEFLRKNNKNRR